MQIEKKDSNIFAILGPTNTGKTYLAFDRVLSYQTGIFGFPLRLLARENYDKAIHRVGTDKVALLTGEEKIFPKNAKYFFCTVESMPTNIEVECVAIDEVQLASDYERGHIFTDRILNSRGSLETIFLGSMTIKSVLKKLFPKIKIDTRDRYSKLLFDKKENISKLKPRSAVIAFNVTAVYEIAEILRSYKGGAAVVLGSLSPRTRNAQVAVYENKNVDYIVATDAIGMGLNLNIDHVSFSSFRKFDGRYNRNLLPAEIGQIAGRAGRFQNDGTFGYTKEANYLDPIIIKSVEEHQFDAVKKIYWRNSKIDFSSIESLINSLKKNPEKNFFIHKKNAEDEINFRSLSKDQKVKKYLFTTDNIKLLWDVCRIPDFQKIMHDNYIDLLKDIFLNLIENDLFISQSWIEEHIYKLEDYSGGIDELSRKIANIRTWTYISNQSNWLKNKDYWQEKTRDIEDNLSDHLHESLTNRFIDVSANYLVNTKTPGVESKIEIKDDKSINLDDQTYGYINGFNLKLFDKIKSVSILTHNYVKKTARTMIEERVNDFIHAPIDSINLGNIQNLNLSDDIRLYWGDEPVGLLKKGENIFSPVAELFSSEFVEAEKKYLIKRKLQEWIDNKIKVTLKPIKDNLEDTILSADVRSITYNLFNFLGTMPIEDYQSDIKNLTEENKSMISKLGIRIGVKFFFIPNFLKKSAIELNAILWRIFYDDSLSGIYPLPKDGRVSFTSNINMPRTYWAAIGYVCIDNFSVRIDIFEKIFFIARKKIKTGPFLESSDLMNPIGCNSTQLSNILSFCGFENILLGNEKRLFFYKQKKVIQKKITRKKSANKKIIKQKIKSIKTKEIKVDPNSPFAVLQKLL